MALAGASEFDRSGFWPWEPRSQTDSAVSCTD